MTPSEASQTYDYASAVLCHHRSANRSGLSTTSRTWRASFRSLSDKDEYAANLLLLWTFIDANDLWHGLLQETADRVAGAPKWLCHLAGSEVKFRAALSILAEFSLAQERDCGSFTLHPGVRSWVATLLDSQQRKRLARLATLMVGLTVPAETAPDCFSLQKRLLPHALRCADELECVHGDEELFDTAAKTAVRNLGELFADLGFPGKAERMYTLILDGPCAEQDKELVYSTKQNLACLYAQADRFAEADSTFQEALSSCESALGPHHALTLTIAHNYGILYAIQGYLNMAKSMYDRALRGRVRNSGVDDPSALDTICCLGDLYVRQGLLAEAERWYHSALTGRNRALGPSHLLTLNTIHSLGMLYLEQGRLDAAEAMYCHAIEHYERLCGPDHLLVLNAINNLGNVFKEQGRFQEAERCYRTALHGYRAALGSQHSFVFGTANNIGNLNELLGRMDDAESMYLYALEGKRKILGTTHISTLHTVYNLGMHYANKGLPRKAEPLFLWAATEFQATLGPLHTKTLQAAQALQSVQGKRSGSQKHPAGAPRAATRYGSASGLRAACRKLFAGNISLPQVKGRMRAGPAT